MCGMDGLDCVLTAFVMGLITYTKSMNGHLRGLCHQLPYRRSNRLLYHQIVPFAVSVAGIDLKI